MHSGDVWSVQRLVFRYPTPDFSAATAIVYLARREASVRDVMPESTMPEVIS